MKNLQWAGLVLLAVATQAVEEQPHPDGFKPSSDLDTFYATPERQAEIRITSNVMHTVSEHFLGMNTSYFNDTDEIWKTYDIPAKLKSSGIGALRYPGGQEASFFHWEHPGVNGYEDLWDDPKQHGYAPKRGPFQVTWVDPSQWADNNAFMSFGEFMAHCVTIGAEPIVGLNLSSGAKHGRQKEGVEEALRWLRYCKDNDHNVTYWFLDNEPWNGEAPHQMDVRAYAAECVRYGKAIKAEFPHVKLIANPFSSESYNAWNEVEYFVREAGTVVDYIDIHFYWEWGRSAFMPWQATTPLKTGSRWKHDAMIRTYQEDFSLLRKAFAQAGHPDMGLMVLEWNIGPSKESLALSQSATALIHGELLMEFMRADVHIACLWPLLWRSSRDVWAEQDPFPSIITQDPPYSMTLSHDLFRMASPLQGMKIIQSTVTAKDLVVLAARRGDVYQILVLNKSPLRRKIAMTFETPLAQSLMDAGYISIRSHVPLERASRRVKGELLDFFVEPFSFNAIGIISESPLKGQNE